MRLITFILNILFIVFTLFVIATDGMAKQLIYIIFTLLLLVMPAYSALIIFRIANSNGWNRLFKNSDMPSIDYKLKTIAIFFNFLVLLFSIWILLSQGTHPQEEGYIEYVITLLLTPVLNLVVIFFSGINNIRLIVKKKSV